MNKSNIPEENQHGKIKQSLETGVSCFKCIYSPGKDCPHPENGACGKEIGYLGYYYEKPGEAKVENNLSIAFKCINKYVRTIVLNSCENKFIEETKFSDLAKDYAKILDDQLKESKELIKKLSEEIKSLKEKIPSEHLNDVKEYSQPPLGIRPKRIVEKERYYIKDMEMNSNNIVNRRGRLILSRDMIINNNEEALKEIFSNFFPVATEPAHRMTYYDSIIYHGISPHFEEVEQADQAPEYEIVLECKENVVKFKEMRKLEFKKEG